MTYPTQLPSAQVIIMLADIQEDPMEYIDGFLIDCAKVVEKLERQTRNESASRIELLLHRADQFINLSAEVVRLAEKYD